MADRIPIAEPADGRKLNVVFVNTGEGKRLRCIYAKVIKDGRVSAGNKVTKRA